MRRALVVLLAVGALLPAPDAFARPRDRVPLITELRDRLAPPNPAPGGVRAAAVSDGTGPLDTDADLEAALRFEALIPEHTFEGMVTPVFYDKWPHLDSMAQPLLLDGPGDSGNYTGVYLAAQSYRYAQAKRELAKLGVDPLDDSPSGPPEAAFWRGQRDEARQRGSQIVRYYNMLVNIAEEWQTEFKLHIDDSKGITEYGWLDFGGGIIPGEAGLLMRACTPEDPAPAFADFRINFPPEQLHGPFRWKDGRDWWCLDATSRDSYAGTVFGLSVALDFLATDENADLRTMIAHDLMAMTDYAIKYLWFQPRPHGMVANPLFGHNDLTGPISPLFIQVAAARLHLLQTARHAAGVVGNDAARHKYDLLWATEMVASVLSGNLLAQMLVDTTNPHDAYYKYQLNLMCLFNMIRLEPNPLYRALMRTALAVQDATTRRHGNAFFEGLTFALTGERERLNDAVDRHREWLDYYAFHEAAAAAGNTPFVHTGRCGIRGPVPPGAPIEDQPLECVPRSRVDMALNLFGHEIVLPFNPGSGAELRSKEPLPVGVRRLADFLWQKDPSIVTGDHDVPWRGPSIDFIGTYWILRYYSEIAVPAREPLPRWFGPSFR
jgi:hypothetical protein